MDKSSSHYAILSKNLEGRNYSPLVGATSEIGNCLDSLVDYENRRFIPISKKEFDSLDEWIEDKGSEVFKDVMIRGRLKAVQTIVLELE